MGAEETPQRAKALARQSLEIRVLFPELTHRWAKRTHSLKLSCDFHMHVWRACPPSHAKKRRGKSNREMMDIQLAEVFTTCSIPLGPERSP